MKQQLTDDRCRRLERSSHFARASGQTTEGVPSPTSIHPIPTLPRVRLLCYPFRSHSLPFLR